MKCEFYSDYFCRIAQNPLTENPYGALPPPQLMQSIKPEISSSRSTAQTLPFRPPSGTSLSNSLKTNGVHRSPSSPQPANVKSGPYASITNSQNDYGKLPVFQNETKSVQTPNNKKLATTYATIPVPKQTDYNQLPIDYSKTQQGDYDALPPPQAYYSGGKTAQPVSQGQFSHFHISNFL